MQLQVRRPMEVGRGDPAAAFGVPVHPPLIDTVSAAQLVVVAARSHAKRMAELVLRRVRIDDLELHRGDEATNSAKIHAVCTVQHPRVAHVLTEPALRADHKLGDPIEDPEGIPQWIEESVYGLRWRPS